jgi:TolB protein
MLGRLLRKLLSRQRSQLWVVHRDGTQAQMVYETQGLIEAPLWSPDGQWWVFNGEGHLYRLRSDGASAPERIAIDGDPGVAGIGNDHVISPDGQTLYFTAQGKIYAVPFAGGRARQVSNDGLPGQARECYVHGISADGQRLCYTGVTRSASGARQAVYAVPTAGGPDEPLTDAMQAVDGPEWTPDGQWVYFNAEVVGGLPGHAQLFRKHRDQAQAQALTRDARVNWFPHVSPDGRWLMYLSYPEKTQGHPANVAVSLRLMPAEGGDPVDVVQFRGGQGTTNTSGWASDSLRFAYMVYPE